LEGGLESFFPILGGHRMFTCKNMKYRFLLLLTIGT